MKQINGTILLVEDDDNLGTLLSEYLNSKGYQTEWLLTVKEG